MTLKNQLGELVNHAQSLEPGATLPIGVPPDEKIETIARYLHQAFQPLPNRKDFVISTHPGVNQIWIKKKNHTAGLVLGAPMKGAGASIPSITPNYSTHSSSSSFNQVVTDVVKGYKDHLISVQDNRKFDGLGDPESVLLPIMGEIAEGNEVTLILDRANTDLWIALGILSTEYHIPPPSDKEKQEEAARIARQIDPFGALSPQSSGPNSRIDSNNETPLESSLTPSQEASPGETNWWEEE